MNYRYYVTDLYDGCIKGTNSTELAEQFVQSEDFFVVDTENNLWLTLDGSEKVKEATE